MRCFNGQAWLEIPDVKPTGGLVCIRVQSTVPLFPVGSRAAFGYNNLTKREAIFKILKYVKAEGIRQALRKVKSRHLDRELLGKRWVVSVYGRRTDNDRPVWALATFDTPYTDLVLVRPELTFEVPCNLEEDLRPWLGVFLPYCTSAMQTLAHTTASQLQDYYELVAGLPPHAEIASDIPIWLNQDTVNKAASRMHRGYLDQWRSAFNQFNCCSQQSRPVNKHKESAKNGKAGAILVGNGNYARVIVVPMIRESGLQLKYAVDLDPLIAQRCKEEYGFQHAATDITEASRDPQASIACICSFHHTHAELAQSLLMSGKKVFIEKPPVVSFDQLDSLCECVTKYPDRWVVGYNRRYAVDAGELRKAVEERTEPITITCIVQEAKLPGWHWYNWQIEGGRIISNLCHWIDLGCYLIRGCVPEEVTYFPASEDCDENASVSIKFSDDSALNLILSTRGDTTLGMTEYIDLRCGEITGWINDFRETRIQKSGKTTYRHQGRRNRGHREMYLDALRRFVNNEHQPFGVDDLWRSSALMLIIREMHLRSEKIRQVRDFFVDGFRPAPKSVLPSKSEY